MPVKKALTFTALAFATLTVYGLVSTRSGIRSRRAKSIEPDAGRRTRKRSRPLLRLRVPWRALSCVPLAAAGLLLALVSLPRTGAGAATTTATFIATEDTYVSSAITTANFGQSPKLRADAYPASERTLLRFRVTGTPQGAAVTSATLRLFVVNTSKEAGVVQSVVGSWNETTTTWANSPTVGNKIADLSEPAALSTWREADVTSVVIGDGTFDFYVVTPARDAVYYSSTEAASNPPTLVVRWVDAPTAVPTETSTSVPSATPESTATPDPTSTPAPSPTAAPTPTATPVPSDPSFQPAPPIRAAFLYPWFPQAWKQLSIYPYTNYTPSLGYYDSKDDTTIDEQLRLAAGAHLDAFIASWWGQGTPTDLAFQYILGRSERVDSPNPNLRWAIYYEQEGQGDPTVVQIVADLQYLQDKAFSQPGYLKVGGQPVVFVYAGGTDGSGMAQRWAQAKAQFGGNVYVVLKVYGGYKSDPNQPDSWHQYAPAVAYDSQLPYSVAVSPGFWKVSEQPRLVRDAATFEANVKRMAASGATWQLITTWNEWGEGSSVEPAAEFGTTYLDIVCRNLPGSAACPGGGSGSTVTPTPTRASTPTPTTTPTPSGNATPTPTRAPTLPPSPGDPVIMGAGDIARAPNVSGAEAVAKLLDVMPGEIFTAGDDSNDSGLLSEYQAYFDPTWGRHLARIHPAPGNHDYTYAGAPGYYQYFGAAAHGPDGYYSYNLGAWHIISLNSNICAGKVSGANCLAGSPMEQWLRADLAANPTACTLVYWHHPRFSSGQHLDQTYVAPIWQALYDYGADIVVNGHDHDYERFAPQDPNGNADPVHGIREFVAGTGGAGPRATVPTVHATSEVYNDNTLGILKFTLHPTSYDWQFVPVAGKTFTDSGSESCR